MSRHRIVRTMDYKDEYDEYDDVYGHSVDDDSCISPTDASQWIYDRARGQQSISAFMANHRNIEEEDEDEEKNGEAKYAKLRRDSENFQMPILDDIEQAKLISCVDEIRNIVGDTVSERKIVEVAMKFNYEVSKALDSILNSSSTPPQESCSDKIPNEPLIEKDAKSSLINRFRDNNDRQSPFKVPLINLNGVSAVNNSSRLNKLIENSLQEYSPGQSQSRNNFVLPSFLSSKGKNSVFKATLKDEKANSNNSNVPCSSHNSMPSFVSGAIGSTLSPLQLSLRKIQESKPTKVDNSKNNDDNTMVDLTTAVTELKFHDQSSSALVEEKRREVKFSIPFIRCDRNIGKIMSHKLNTSSRICFTNVPSRAGRIICLKYCYKLDPSIRQKFENIHKLDIFKFGMKALFNESVVGSKN